MLAYRDRHGRRTSAQRIVRSRRRLGIAVVTSRLQRQLQVKLRHEPGPHEIRGRDRARPSSCQTGPRPGPILPAQPSDARSAALTSSPTSAVRARCSSLRALCPLSIALSPFLNARTAQHAVRYYYTAGAPVAFAFSSICSPPQLPAAAQGQALIAHAPTRTPSYTRTSPAPRRNLGNRARVPTVAHPTGSAASKARPHSFLFRAPAPQSPSSPRPSPASSLADIRARHHLRPASLNLDTRAPLRHRRFVFVRKRLYRPAQGRVTIPSPMPLPGIESAGPPPRNPSRPVLVKTVRQPHHGHSARLCARVGAA